MRFIYFIITIFVFISCNTKSEKKLSNDNQVQNHFLYISNLQLPDELSFCGEKVPLEIEEVKERAEREFYLLLQQPGQIILYLKRSGRYFPLYERIFKELQVPDDLKYLSVAESALYMARSPKNALGLWQFITSTAKAMGLRINKYIDERKHPEKSTYAAVKYLLLGYKATKSWFAAAAGYNMGHSSLNEHLKYQNKDDVFDLFMNEETSRYLLRIVIIKEIMQNAKKYGFQLNENDFYKPYNSKTIEVKKINNIADWAKEHNTSYKYVRLYNLWILGKKLPYVSRNFKYKVEIPAE